MHLLLLTSPKQTYNQQAPSRSATPSQPMLSTPRASSPPPPVMQLRQVCVYLNSFLYVSSHPSVCLCVLVCVRACVCANSTGWRPKKSCASHLSTFLSCFCYACLYMSVLWYAGKQLFCAFAFESTWTDASFDLATVEKKMYCDTQSGLCRLLHGLLPVPLPLQLLLISSANRLLHLLRHLLSQV